MNLKFIKLGLILLLIDSVYLNLIGNYFSNQIKLVQKENMQVKMLGFVLTYLFLTLGLYYFIIKENKSYLDAFILGLCVYGVYEYTNYSLLNNWKMETTIIDTLWGGLLFVITTYVYNNFV